MNRKARARGKTERDIEARIHYNLKRYGWQAMSIANPPRNIPQYSYTIGLTPPLKNFLLFGVNGTEAHALFNRLVNHVQQQGLPELNDPISNILDDHELMLIRIPERITRLYCRWAYIIDDESQFVHVVWPDKAGLYPWAKGFNAELKPLQPTFFDH